MVAALRLSNRCEMWDMSSPETQGELTYMRIQDREKKRIRTFNVLSKILKSIFSIKHLISCMNTFVWLLYTFPKTSTTWYNRHNIALFSKSSDHALN